MPPFNYGNLTRFSLVALCAFSKAGFAAETRIDTATQQVQRTGLKRMLEQPAVEVVPSLYPGEEHDLGPQVVVRDQTPKAKREWLEFAFDLQYASTSNVSLVRSNRVESTLMISTAQIALAPTPWDLPNGTLAVKAGYRHQKFNYGLWTNNERNLNDLDFDASTIFAQGRYLFHENWVATFGMDYTRLLTAGGTAQYDEFYSEYSPSVTLERHFKVDEKSQVTASIGSAWHATHVDPPNTDHNDHADETFMVSYVRALTPKCFIQPFYKAQFSQYLRGKRVDLLQTAGVALSYSFNDYASLRVFANFETRESTEAEDYRKIDSGGGLSLQVRF